jgi:hypothetical protein
MNANVFAKCVTARTFVSACFHVFTQVIETVKEMIVAVVLKPFNKQAGYIAVASSLSPPE